MYVKSYNKLRVRGISFFIHYLLSLFFHVYKAVCEILNLVWRRYKPPLTKVLKHCLYNIFMTVSGELVKGDHKQ